MIVRRDGRRAPPPLATLIRLLLSGVSVLLDDFHRAVAPMHPSAWAATRDGLFEKRGVIPSVHEAIEQLTFAEAGEGVAAEERAEVSEEGR
jgi:hypothetical protein